MGPNELQNLPVRVFVLVSLLISPRARTVLTRFCETRFWLAVCSLSCFVAVCAVVSSTHKSRSVVKWYMMIAELVQELSSLLSHLEKRRVISLRRCIAHCGVLVIPRTLSRATLVSVVIQCYFTPCVVLAISAHSEQCEFFVCSNRETCLQVHSRTQWSAAFRALWKQCDRSCLNRAL